MLKVAIVDDEERERDQLASYVARFAQETGREMETTPYRNGFDLLSVFEGQFNLILLDIQMGDENGIRVAEEIRRIDERVNLMFVTNLGQYAVQGYAVRAMDFVVKPVSYGEFRRKMERFCHDFAREEPRFLTIRNTDGLLHLRTDRICYAEIVRRKLYIHTVDGTYSVYETLQNVEQALSDPWFFRCHAAVLVNLRYVEQVGRQSAVVAGDDVPVSKRNRSELLRRLTNQLSREML